jgi:putative ABC transport system permease protein
MVLGRGLRSGDDQLGAATVVVLAYETWQTHFGGSSSVLGQTIRVNDLPVTVIGVADRGSMDSPLERRPALWIPLAAMAVLSPRDATAKDFLQNARFCCVSLAGRLRGETSRTAAQAELTGLNRNFQSGESGNRSISLGMLVRTTAGTGQPEARDVIPILTLLVAGVLLVLGLACANVANLQLARALARRQEMTIRLSLGASRFRLVRQLLVEGLLLSMAAGGMAWLIAEGLPVLILRQMGSDSDVGALDIAPDAHVFLSLVVLSVASCLLSGLAPAMRTTRMLVAGRHGRRSPLRSALLATQVAISTVLLLGAALLTRGITHATSFEPGFQIQDVLAMSIALPPKTYDSVQRVAFGAAVTEAVARSGIGQVALTANVPLSGGWLIAPVRLPEQSPDAERLAHVQSVSTGYFDVLHIPLKAGRLFDPNAGSNEVVINETLARLLWPEGTALGQQFLTRGDARRVVGVVRDAYTESLDHVEPTLYEHARGAVSHLLLRDDPSAAERLRALVVQIEPRATVSAKRLTEGLAKQLASSVLGATLGRALGLLALLVATVGTFSVFSCLVAERTREIGVRLAIGARPRDVLGLVLSRAARPLATGLGLGVIASLAFGPFLTTYLFGVSPRDAIAYAAVAAILTMAAAVAVFQPARRAIGIDPAITLRHD